MSSGPRNGLVIERLQYRYGDHGFAITIDECAVSSGACVGVLGASGAGKSTLLRVLSGFLRQQRGSIQIGGVDVSRSHPRDRGTQLVFQDLRLFDHMTVRQNVHFGLRNAPSQILTDLLRHFELDALAERLPTTLSVGQRQRVAIARAVAVAPQLLLLDEPTSALDASLRRALMDMLHRIVAETGASTIVVSHDVEFLFRATDRVLVLEDGIVVADGVPFELYSDPPSLTVGALLGDLNQFQVTGSSRAGEVLIVEVADGRINVEGLGDLPGKAAWIAFRPECASLRPSSPSGTQCAVAGVRAVPGGWHVLVNMGGRIARVLTRDNRIDSGFVTVWVDRNSLLVYDVDRRRLPRP